jgi:hypothetical protein
MSEQLESSIYERAYTVYNKVCMKTDATIKELIANTSNIA